MRIFVSHLGLNYDPRIPVPELAQNLHTDPEIITINNASHLHQGLNAKSVPDLDPELELKLRLCLKICVAELGFRSFRAGGC